MHLYIYQSHEQQCQKEEKKKKSCVTRFVIQNVFFRLIIVLWNHFGKRNETKHTPVTILHRGTIHRRLGLNLKLYT